MNSKNFLPLRVLLAILLLFQFQGCTIIGLTIGALKDRAQPNTMPVEITHLKTVKPGTHITLMLKDGSILQGEYRNLTIAITPGYHQEIDRYRSQLAAVQYFPAIGDSIRLILTNGKQVANTFAGVDIQFLLLNGKAPSLPIRIPLSGIRTLQDAHHHTLSVERLQEGIESGKIPVATQVRVSTTEGNISIPLQKIQQVKIATSRQYAAKGALIGLGIDFLVFIWIARGLGPVPVGG